MNRQPFFPIGLIALVLLYPLGCSRTTMREIGQKHHTAIEGVIAELRLAAESMPPADFDPDTRQLDPAPYMHVADRLSNTAMGSRDQFLGITKRTDDPTYFNMYTFAYEGLLGDRFLAQVGEPTFEAEVEAFVNLRYAIVYHPVDYHDATITDKEFQVEPLKMVVGMYDLQAKKWLFAKSFLLEPPESIDFTYRQGQREANAAFQVQDFFVETAKPLIKQYIESQFGGTIEFDHDAYRRDGTRRLPY